ncbi:1,2-phenylacetyl-CoA epoxidase subunit PaaC [Anderseniella sp. Alg231-50]|uniref:1,2-phenylacetyl-CoA epoxidase subunit PaaC n=1 Tax=Anderseniella sp. Alg231-50 TaxID=1922226 RepID=UPI000D54FDF8
MTGAAISHSHLFEAVLQLADDHLILGQRVSEWCGHAPMLEEDLGLANMALDLLGQSRALYAYAAEIEGAGRSEDDLAFLRLERQYLNCLLVERPNGDFAHSILRQLYFAAFMHPFWQWVSANSADDTLRGIAGKAEKEMAYHVRHCGEWVVRLGDGTGESARRMKAAVDALHHYTDELFQGSAAMADCAGNGILPDVETLRPAWTETITNIFAQGLLEVPDVAHPQTGGRSGEHGEEMGHILTELQYMQRTYPNLQW